MADSDDIKVNHDEPSGITKPRNASDSASSSRLSSKSGPKRSSHRSGNHGSEHGLEGTISSTDPVKLEMNRLENLLKAKSRDLERSLAECKALKLTNSSTEKAVAAIQSQVHRLEDRLHETEEQLDARMLELKKANELKKDALASQAAAELTLRRIQATQGDLSVPSLELALAPLESELKVAQKEIARFQEDSKAQERLMRTKEAALLEAERAVQAAEEKAAQVDDLVNQNHNLHKQIEKMQEENRTLDRLHKQKVEEVEKLTAQVEQLQEELTVAGASASTIQNLNRQVNDLQNTQRKLQEELARAKVVAQRVASAVANEWKDDNDKVIPMRTWLEERKFLMGDIDKLREKLSISEKHAKYELQMKEKLQQRLKVVEGIVGANKNLQSNRRSSLPAGPNSQNSSITNAERVPGTSSSHAASQEREDVVSGVLHDLLQKEVVILQKALGDKDRLLKESQESVEVLTKKSETLAKALDVETRKAKREAASLEKELKALKELGGGIQQRRLSGRVQPVARK